MRLRDLTGQKFNMLKVLHRAETSRNGSVSWLCLCDCGKQKVYSSDHLTRKKYPVKSCGCMKKTIKGENHHQWNGIGDISGNWWYNHVLRERVQTSRKKIPVEIDIKYAWNLFKRQKKKCKLSGIPLVISGTSKYNTASLDRIDSSKGYIKGNVQWVHKHINFMKRTYDQDYFIKMCKKVAKESK